MPKIVEPAREIDVIHETDVRVVGCGPGGLAAALSLKSDRTLRNVSVDAMRTELRRQGVRYQ